MINYMLKIIMPRRHRAEAISDDARLSSDDVCLSVCLSVTYIGPLSSNNGEA